MKLSAEEALGKEKVGRLLVKLSVPAMIGMLVQAMYNFVDTIFVGRAVGSLGIAAISISFPMQIFIMAFAQLLGIGGSSLVSRALGAGNRDRANRTVGNVLLGSIVFGLLMALLGTLFLDPLLRLLGASDTILPYARDYLGVIILGAVFFSFGMAMNNLIRAEGRARVAMLTMLISGGLNIALDPIFIIVLGLGVRGAAIATVISQATTSLYVFWYFISGRSALSVKKNDLIPDFRILKETFLVGSSAFARQISGSMLAIIINNSLVFYGGDISVAVYGVINRLMMVFMLPMFGINQGFMPILGYNYGAKNYSRARQSVNLALLSSTALAVIAFVTLFFFPQQMVSIFTNEEQLILEASSVMRIIVFVAPLIGIQVIAAGMFQALGKAMIALLLSMLRQIILLIPLVLILPLSFGLMGIWIAFPIADGTAFVISLIFYTRQVKSLQRSSIESNEVAESAF
ncbi:MAG: MATE efflux family protein [Thermotogales bacterium 46_20]|nr:MAG: MATE efflux family protein [Thermotogales bacterium 46_20]